MKLLPSFLRPKKGKQNKQAYVSIDDRSWSKVFDWLPGAWQQDRAYDHPDSVISHPTVYACISRIATDVGKLRPMVQQMRESIWAKTDPPRYIKLLIKPNSYQNHIEFKENWIHSKLTHGNTYALKVRGDAGVVDELLILDPTRVTPLVGESGDVWYRLDPDNLSRFGGTQITVPASEVIHDKINALFHPLVGLSPLFASTVAAKGGLAILKDTRSFFENGANPAGILMAPGPIEPETIQRLKEQWKQKYSGDNTGDIAVIGGGMTYQAHKMNATDAQLVEQLKLSSEAICSVYAVPPHMVGVGQMPTHDNIEALTQAYYSNCLQIHIEKFELLVAMGLDMPNGTRIELDLDGLFRTDTTRKIDILTKGVSGMIMKPNEARAKMNLEPVEGGDSVYSQQQYYSLEALSKRDSDDPFAKPLPVAEPENSEDDEDEEEIRAMLLYGIDQAQAANPMTSLLRGYNAN
jgi:HK97 family phage portal protein